MEVAAYAMNFYVDQNIMREFKTEISRHIQGVTTDLRNMIKALKSLRIETDAKFLQTTFDGARYMTPTECVLELARRFYMTGKIEYGNILVELVLDENLQCFEALLLKYLWQGYKLDALRDVVRVGNDQKLNSRVGFYAKTLKHRTNPDNDTASVFYVYLPSFEKEFPGWDYNYDMKKREIYIKSGDEETLPENRIVSDIPVIFSS